MRSAGGGGGRGGGRGGPYQVPVQGLSREIIIIRAVEGKGDE
jgi:hypothetical protein